MGVYGVRRTIDEMGGDWLAIDSNWCDHLGEVGAGGDMHWQNAETAASSAIGIVMAGGRLARQAWHEICSANMRQGFRFASMKQCGAERRDRSQRLRARLGSHNHQTAAVNLDISRATRLLNMLATSGRRR